MAMPIVDQLTRRTLLLAFAAGPLAGASVLRAAPGREELLNDETLPDLWIGNPDAKVSIIEYASVSCSHCAEFHLGTYKALKQKYIDTGKVRFVLREFPSDPLAMAGFMLARCDGDAEKRAAMLELLFTEQRIWLDPPNGDAVGTLSNLVRRQGLSHGDFETCLRRMDVYEKIVRMRTHAVDRFGVDSTPTFFVNGEKLVGNHPLQAFEAIIEPMLK
jgi:protein-disulfide isomerase